MVVNLGYVLIIQILVLLLMGFMVWKNTMLSNKQRNVYVVIFSLIAFISLVEYLAGLVNDNDTKWISANYILNYLGFSLTVFLPILFAYAIDSENDIRIPVIVMSVFPIFLLISLPFGWIFSVDEYNVYTRGPLYFIYIIVLLLGLAYLFVVSIKMIKKFQKNNKSILFLNFIFLMIGGSLQIVFPEARVTWITVTSLSIIYYEYCNNLWHQIDGLTKLLSQESFIASTRKITDEGILVLFDIDNFKAINDNYGHTVGDEYLKVFASKLIKVYNNYGNCYRIGGDEFACLLDVKCDVSKLNKTFDQEMKDYNLQFITNPSVSYGICIFKKGDNILNIKDIADERMYRYKKRRKEGKTFKN